ncbi:MAG: glycerophosphodiester phosphodiesterase [Bacteroidales bacterium]|nr:glycerophosphodiester phosphodiesterase [Bacteroidales bacterium]
MKKLKHFILLTAVISMLYSCNNDSKIIAHRGSGNEISIDNYDTIFENTIAAAKYGFKNFDGIEVDVQMSKSGTIWLYHNSDLYSFDTLSPRCIPSSTDAEIIAINSNLPKWQQLCKLDEVLKYQNSLDDDKYISLDIKGYFENSCLPKQNISWEYQKEIATEIIRLYNKYDLGDLLLVETDYTYFLDEIVRDYNKIEVYYLGFNNFTTKMDFAIKHNYTGLSFNMNDTSLNERNIKTLHDKGLKIQIWTVNNNSKKQKALDLNADYIQSDVVF